MSKPVQLTNPNHCSFLWEQFHTSFLENCAKLSASEPWLDDEELEQRAQEITTRVFYLRERENLPDYQNRAFWEDMA